VVSAVPTEFAEALSDRYTIRHELGRGGMATVYLADDLKHGRRVALKVMRPELAAEIGQDRFLREIGIAARLNHPHIVPLYDSGVARGHPYYVMPFIEGESLRARLQSVQHLPVEEALRLTREVASALGYAHQQGLVHRDIKPENILLADGMALVADFGVARANGQGVTANVDATLPHALTQVGAIVGTPRYMAPEQAVGGTVDARADLYSLACVLYEMLAGQPPFVSPTFEALAREHLTAEPPAINERVPAVPPGVSAAIAKGLAKLPADRHETAARFVEALALPDPIPTATDLADAAGVSTPSNLPPERTRFVGREQVLAECARLLDDTRLLTITGIGGCGKTRLALRLARERRAVFPDGVWFVDLAPLQDPEHVALVAATAAGVREEAGTPVLETLTRHVASRRVLFVLDNCEHVLGGAAETAEALLASSPGIKLIATSREGLGVEGEQSLALRSLAVPTASTVDPRAIAGCEAVSLFVDRAQLVDPSFVLDHANAVVVSEICRRVDGIPLALELAAARVKVLTVEEIRARLDDRFQLLAGGRRALARHQTLRATIRWSYDLLTDEERRLFRRLAVFSGGWTLDALARVASDVGDEFAVLEVLTHLVDKSLVTIERRVQGVTRYAMLETVRQYAHEQLSDSGEADPVRRRHLAVFADLAECAYADRLSVDDRWTAVLEMEHDNLSAALDLARAEDAERYLQLSGALAWFWQLRSYYHEGRERLSEALAGAPSTVPRPARARALWGVANLTARMGDGGGALPAMQEALGIWRGIGDRREVALALEGVGWAQLLGGDDAAACATFRECLQLQNESGDRHLINRAMVALAQVLVVLTEVAEARTMAQEIIEFSAAQGDQRNEHFGWHYLADCALIEGRCNASLGFYRRSLALAHPLGDQLETSFEVQGVAMSLAGLGRSEPALRLAAAAVAEWKRIGTDLHIRFWDALLDRYIGGARHALGDDAADRAWCEGLQLPFEQAVEEALSAGAPAPSD
jgi:non-specific serine/threonine protein kinase